MCGRPGTLQAYRISCHRPITWSTMKIDVHPAALEALQVAWHRDDPQALTLAVREVFDGQDGELLLVNKALNAVDRCGVCGKHLDRGDDFPADVPVRSHGMNYTAHDECADELLTERKAFCGSGEHDWPADLRDDDAECERGCGLRYSDWSE